MFAATLLTCRCIVCHLATLVYCPSLDRLQINIIYIKQYDNAAHWYYKLFTKRAQQPIWELVKCTLKYYYYAPVDGHTVFQILWNSLFCPFWGNPVLERQTFNGLGFITSFRFWQARKREVKNKYQCIFWIWRAQKEKASKALVLNIGITLKLIVPNYKNKHHIYWERSTTILQEVTTILGKFGRNQCFQQISLITFFDLECTIFPIVSTRLDETSCEIFRGGTKKKKRREILNDL